MKKLLGSVEPRLFTPPLRKLTRNTSRGFEVIDWIENVLGETLYPHQKWILIHALETMPRIGKLRFRHCLIIEARRNGKTHSVNTLSAYHLAHGPAQIKASSSQRDTARETFLDLTTLVEDHPDVFPGVKPRMANGQEEIAFKGQRSRYKVVATNRKGGRGQAAKLAIEDELREHDSWEAHSALSPVINTLPDGQLWMCSNAGDRTSVVLNTLRARALSDIEEGNTGTKMFYAEWSAPDGCDIDDRNAWAMANPLMNRLLDESTIESALTLPASEFRTEYLSQFVPSLSEAITQDGWSACYDPGTMDAHRSRVVACLDVSLDMMHVTLMVATTLSDGRVRVETAGAWDSTREALNDLGDLLGRIKPRVFAWLPSGPAAAISTDLKSISKNQEVSGSEVTAACQELADLVRAGRIAHSGDEMLTGQLLGARKLMTGDGWKFSRKDGWADAAYACAVAVHIARSLPPPSTMRVITPFNGSGK